MPRKAQPCSPRQHSLLPLAETFAKPLNRPRLRAGACSFPGFLPAAISVAGIWSTGSYPSNLGFAKAGPRSGAWTETELFKGLLQGELPKAEGVPLPTR